MKKSLLALSFGTLGLGIAEFVMMGILPEVARDMDISIAAAGHFISAYALGVCVGAPMLVTARRFSLKRILLVLVAVVMAGNVVAASAPDYRVLLLGRFVSGLPHGAYFGVGSIVADRLADKGRGSEAVSVMVAGMTVANLLGVPLGTSLAATVSWRATFVLVAVLSVLIFYFICRWVPEVEGLPDTGFKGQFRFLRSPAPWLVLGATMLGNGGILCWYSYVAPFMTQVAGFGAHALTPVMILAGGGMVAGNLLSGRLSDRFTPGRVAAVTQGAVAVVLLVLFFAGEVRWAALAMMTMCTAGLFAVSSPQQVLMIRCSKGGELLGAASVQVAFNLGNALGAYLGGLPIQAGMGYRYPALEGAVLAVAGFVMLLAFVRGFERRVLA